ncbi:MAG: twitching motility protein PilT [Coxiella sp. RIFCSPHIGHO2_12_FULL_42_15]|nr:MAG: twitching motility protein PilT [Coxiella sp. RIFCSPHIGHO2_12_FULL_42_15]
MDIHALLRLAVEKKASDLHLSSGEAPIVRLDGELERLAFPVLNPAELLTSLHQILTEPQKKQVEEKNEIDFSYVVPALARFRVNIFWQHRGVSAAFRTIPFSIPTLEQLELPKIFEAFCAFSNGLVIVTGPTGSGKSTTLAAMINYINHRTENRKHIITIEDPIEYLYDDVHSLIQQREVGNQTKGFDKALRAALREDPDIILVGEMRDLETIQLALTAAETGHLVFATLHTSSAAQSIDRIIDVFPVGEKEMIRTMLAESLKAIIAQMLLKRPEGGRRAAIEIMLCTPAIRNLIREHKVAQIYSIIQTQKALGMRTMEQHVEELVRKNLVIHPERSIL